MVRRNWKQLEVEFLTGKYKDLTEFATLNKIPYSTLFNHSKKWQVKLQKVNDKVVDKAADLLAKMTIKHALLGQKVQNIGIRALERADKAKSIDTGEAIQAIKAGTDIERNVLAPKDGPREAVQIVFQSFSNGDIKRPTVECTEIKEITPVITIQRPKEKDANS